MTDDDALLLRHPRLELALSLAITAAGSFVVVTMLIAQRVIRRATNGAFP